MLNDLGFKTKTLKIFGDVVVDLLDDDNPTIEDYIDTITINNRVYYTDSNKRAFLDMINWYTYDHETFQNVVNVLEDDYYISTLLELFNEYEYNKNNFDFNSLTDDVTYTHVLIVKKYLSDFCGL